MGHLLRIRAAVRAGPAGPAEPAEPHPSASAAACSRPGLARVPGAVRHADTEMRSGRAGRASDQRHAAGRPGGPGGSLSRASFPGPAPPRLRPGRRPPLRRRGRAAECGASAEPHRYRRRRRRRVGRGGRGPHAAVGPRRLRAGGDSQRAPPCPAPPPNRRRADKVKGWAGQSGRPSLKPFLLRAAHEWARCTRCNFGAGALAPQRGSESIITALRAPARQPAAPPLSCRLSAPAAWAAANPARK